MTATADPPPGDLALLGLLLANPTLTAEEAARLLGRADDGGDEPTDGDADE